MQEEPEFLGGEDDELDETGDEDAPEEGAYEEFEEEAEFEQIEDEMEPDETLEPAGEQSPNTREAFEEEDEDPVLLEGE
ncbi:MAG: hypothetical protein SVY41_02545 [Candidatus Nanohaloarchaea archaeon]|nr:hypothetical protein [Candidatus Nanohaloarchaea archaeon]